MSSTFRSYSVRNLDLEEFIQMETVCNELRKETDTLKESLLKEKSKNVELIQRLHSNLTSEARSNDERYIEELEKELRNCSLEIGYLQDQLNLRNVESNYMGKQVHSLELKLAEVGTLHEKLKLLSEALIESDSRHLNLHLELKDKEQLLHNYILQIEELETALSSIALESQCEIESMRLEISALEERCFEVERLGSKTAKEKDEMDLRLEMYKSDFQHAQERMNCLEMENKDLKRKLLLSEANAHGSCSKVVENLDAWLKHNGSMGIKGPSGCLRDLLVKLVTEFPLLKEICTCEELCCLFVSNPAAVMALDDHVKEEMEGISNQIPKFELQVMQLKEELRTEKLKAKEEAEDLTQAMAELRYQMTDMLEEECKRRATIEQTSLRRIHDLEEQVRKEQDKQLAATRHFQEMHKLAEMRAVEIRNLKNALEGFRKINAETAQKSESCNCTVLNNCSECSTEDSMNQALLEWYPDDKATPALEEIKKADTSDATALKLT